MRARRSTAPFPVRIQSFNEGIKLGNAAVLRSLHARDFVDEHFGIPTVTDILGELLKPGRDPRPEFRTAKFADGIKKTIKWYLENREWWETIISGEYQNYYEKMYGNREKV